MGELREVIDAPLSSEELAVRYRSLCDDPLLQNVPGKIELDSWGRILMSPAGTYHALVQGRLCRKLAVLGGESFVEASIVTSIGVFVPDVVWTSTDFMRAHRNETPLTRAPEICVEVASPGNSTKEPWIAYPQSRRFEFFTTGGKVTQSGYAVELSGSFD